jgi:pantoate--beta-alanine ligase
MGSLPNTVASPEDFRAACDAARAAGRRVGLVPTMGALHEGHLSLVREARKHADFVAVSIFVNPTQFGPNEDFARYPRDLEADRSKLAGAGADLVFAPDARDMYLPGERTRVRVNELTDALCGPFRPGHFEGVTTVVAKLFSLTGPCAAVFGKKDYQQFLVLSRMVRDLFFPVTMIGFPIVREADGLAMSSRNAYLTPAERERALGLSRGLTAAWRAFVAGERDAAALHALAHREVERVADSVDYVDVLDPETLSPFSAPIADRALLAIACHVGRTRLIDNVVLGGDPVPNGQSGPPGQSAEG